MAPARTSARRGAHPEPSPAHDADNHDPTTNKSLFLDLMLGTPLAMYVEKDVDDKDAITQLIVSHGGTVSQGYSGVTYILVDPHKPSGQNLWRQYSNKKGKVVLNAQWVRECVKANQLQTYHSDWAGCKVTGTEQVYQTPRPRVEESTAPTVPTQASTQQAAAIPARQMQGIHPHALQAQMPPPVEPMNPYFPVYPPRGIPGAPPPQQWGVAMPPPPHMHPPPPAPGAPHPHPHMLPPRPSPGPSSQPQYRDDTWQGYSAAPEEIQGQPASYDYRYRDEQGWPAPPGPPYYEPAYEQGYAQPPYMDEAHEQSSGANSVTGQPQMQGGSVPPPAGPSNETGEKPRGRKRTRVQPTPAAPASSLVVSRKPPARSPTPPSRVVKSTYGGNLFTADDIMYLQKYIEYCQEQCLVLSLREICERIAVKAPHHTFYSWRRYCNKHQIRLGGYAMAHDRSTSPGMNDELGMDIDGEGRRADSGPIAGPSSVRLDMAAATAAAAAAPRRNRSPTPPRALFRSTTGKGVAFTQEDVTFLIRFMEYRKSRGDLDMVAFWKDVAIKAPHHSRASWMKFWRRHKHELSPNEGDEPLPAPPDKKMRYSKEDDVLLAKYFYNKPDGTSDKIFQAFGRLHPHHPWKGWQEHHRIHKTKIEHLMQLIGQGEDIDLYIQNET